jgi:hypothetical protein
MRRLADVNRLKTFMRRLGDGSKQSGRVYLTGGATALLLGWRSTTIDIDLKLDTNAEPVLRLIPQLKEELQVNVELASPGDFIPELPGWVERSQFIVSERQLDFFHYDFYAQALSKIERGHAQDLGDVDEMLSRGLIHRREAKRLFDEIEPELYRYPAITPIAFRQKVDDALREN